VITAGMDCSPSPNTRSPSGDPAASAPQPGTGAYPTPTAFSPVGQPAQAARSPPRQASRPIPAP
jgi:hypothetical protein